MNESGLDKVTAISFIVVGQCLFCHTFLGYVSHCRHTSEAAMLLTLCVSPFARAR